MPIEEFESPSRGDHGSRLSAWLPVLLVLGGFSLPWLPSEDALLNALLVGIYLTYTAAVTGVHILPWLSAKLN